MERCSRSPLIHALRALLASTATLACSPAVLHPAFESGDALLLEAGKPRVEKLVLSNRKDRTFRIDVPASAVLLRVKLTCRQAELDLSARSTAPSDDDASDPDFQTTTDGGEATLSIGRFSDPALAAGRHWLEVSWGSEQLPRTVDKRIEEVPFTIEAEIFQSRVDGALLAGRFEASAIDAKSGGFRTFKIDVPESAPALRIDLTDVPGDLDIFARRGAPVIALGKDVIFAQHVYGKESLIVAADTTPALRPGSWFIDVVDVWDDDRPTPFKILASFDKAPPAELLEIPALPSPSTDNPLSRALIAVVEIEADDGMGSGTILTPDGWILTNAHVVASLGGASAKEVVISISLDAHRPPVEMFRAAVEKVDTLRDLALVRITTGFYGQPLPPGYEPMPLTELSTGTRVYRSVWC